MKRPEVMAVVSEVLNEEPGSLQGGEKLKDLPGWDSLAVVSFMGMVDEKFGIVVEPEDISRCDTVNDLASLADQQVV